MNKNHEEYKKLVERLEKEKEPQEITKILWLIEGNIIQSLKPDNNE